MVAPNIAIIGIFTYLTFERIIRRDSHEASKHFLKAEKTN